MRRPWWFRFAAGALSVWLVLVLGEQGFVHECPMHDGVAAVSGMRANAPGAMMAMPMADHAQHRVASAPSNKGTAPDHSHHACTCVGCCVGGTAVALITAPLSAHFEATLVSVADSRIPVVALPRPAPSHSRPYTTGPPSA